MRKSYLILTLCVLAFATIGAGIAAIGFGHVRHENRSQFIKKHRRNRTTIQVDSVDVGVSGLASDTLWGIRGLGKDTSTAFNSWPYMSHRFVFDDTTSDDSVSLKVKLYMGSRPERFSTNRSWPPPYGQTFSANYWVLVDSLTITGHLPTFKVWTGSPIPSSPWCYLTIEGLAANSKLTRVKGTVVADHWDELPK